MCGITVFFGDHTVANLDTHFKRGSKRGPEQYTYECNQDVHLGFHRLAINGLNQESSQPLHYKNYVMVCNGEIYNYKEIIERYKFKMNTQSDCEVIVRLYELLKEKCLDELDGEFAFVIHDLSDNHIFAARDPYGVRPLYINESQNSFCLSSDLSPMKFLPMIEVKQFPPGHYSEFHQKQNLQGYTQESFRYHFIGKPNISILNPPIHSNVPAILRAMGDLSPLWFVYASLYTAVRKRVLNTERPVACLLSGGLDSSLVAAIAARICKQEGKQLETYSIGLSGSEDLKFSSKVAEHIKSKHTQLICTEDTFFDSIPNVIRDIESYDTTTVRASVGNWNIGKYIRENSEAKVVLNGDGADEVMGGYLYFHACPDEEQFDKECHRLLDNISFFDVLRSDKSIASHGLEPRTPYLDKAFVDAYISLPKSVRYHKGHMEKYVIRSIIEWMDPTLIPHEILFRKKEAFSDGVSSMEKSWYQTIQERISVSESSTNYDFNIPTTDEQRYYRELFRKFHKDCDHLIPYFWMPRFVKASDASARTLSQYKETNLLSN
jgi:asparagine synthase (glutamine-hydrolysing)